MKVIRLLLVALLAMSASSVEAAITFQLRTGDALTNTQSMAQDSNKCNTSGPRAAFVGGIVTNTGAAEVTDVSAAISGLGSGFFLAGGQPATQYIGTLGAGQSTGVYWFVGYGCTIGATTNPLVTISSSTTPSTTLLNLVGRSAISANAGGQVTSSVLGAGAVVGQTISFDATYEFGGASTGDEYFLQPSGGQNFDAACFRLVSTRIQSSNVAAVPQGAVNRQYFVASATQPGSGYALTIRYNFEYQCAGASTTARPYAVQTSGNINIKYTGNFDGAGSISLSFPGATNPFTITKSSDISFTYAGTAATVKYTVTVSNPSAYASRISSITDTLPSGASFLALDAASDVTAANSSRVPASGATGAISFIGTSDQSYLISAGGTVKLTYTVKMSATAGTYINSAYAKFGTATTPTASANFIVYSVSPLTLVKASQASSDPYNGSTNPKLIPGSRAAYTVSVSNPNAFALTSDSIVVVDPTPGNLKLYVADISGSGSGPILFQNGSTASGLIFTYSGLTSTTDDVEFSNDNGATWTYVPIVGADGSDGNLTHVRIRPKGAMAAGSSFNLLLQYVVR